SYRLTPDEVVSGVAFLRQRDLLDADFALQLYGEADVFETFLASLPAEDDNGIGPERGVAESVGGEGVLDPALRGPFDNLNQNTSTMAAISSYGPADASVRERLHDILGFDPPYSIASALMDPRFHWLWEQIEALRGGGVTFAGPHLAVPYSIWNPPGFAVTPNEQIVYLSDHSGCGGFAGGRATAHGFAAAEAALKVWALALALSGSVPGLVIWPRNDLIPYRGERLIVPSLGQLSNLRVTVERAAGVLRGTVATQPLTSDPCRPVPFVLVQGADGNPEFLMARQLEDLAYTGLGPRLPDLNTESLTVEVVGRADGSPVDRTVPISLVSVQGDPDFVVERKPVIFAGEWTLESGKITYLNSRSGSYRLTPEEVVPTVAWLRTQNLFADDVTLHLYGEQEDFAAFLGSLPAEDDNGIGPERGVAESVGGEGSLDPALRGRLARLILEQRNSQARDRLALTDDLDPIRLEYLSPPDLMRVVTRSWSMITEHDPRWAVARQGAFLASGGAVLAEALAEDFPALAAYLRQTDGVNTVAMDRLMAILAERAATGDDAAAGVGSAAHRDEVAGMVAAFVALPLTTAQRLDIVREVLAGVGAINLDDDFDSANEAAWQQLAAAHFGPGTQLLSPQVRAALFPPAHVAESGADAREDNRTARYLLGQVKRTDEDLVHLLHPTPEFAVPGWRTVYFLSWQTPEDLFTRGLVAGPADSGDPENFRIVGAEEFLPQRVYAAGSLSLPVIQRLLAEFRFPDRASRPEVAALARERGTPMIVAAYLPTGIQAGRVDADPAGSDRAGSDRAESDRAESDRAGSDMVETGGDAGNSVIDEDSRDRQPSLRWSRYGSWLVPTGVAARFIEGAYLPDWSRDPSGQVLAPDLARLTNPELDLFFLAGSDGRPLDP
ncbi:MAG: hypothetical protein ACRCYU_00500, partial [Nocardioides sp.]